MWPSLLAWGILAVLILVPTLVFRSMRKKRLRAERANDRSLPTGHVRFIFYRYSGFLLYCRQQRYDLVLPVDEAKVLLKKLVRQNLTWGLLCLRRCAGSDVSPTSLTDPKRGESTPQSKDSRSDENRFAQSVKGGLLAFVTSLDRRTDTRGPADSFPCRRCVYRQFAMTASPVTLGSRCKRRSSLARMPGSNSKRLRFRSNIEWHRFSSAWRCGRR